MLKKEIFYASIFVPAVLTFLGGCSALKASPSESSGFIAKDQKMIEMRERAPFNAGFVPDRKRLDDLKKVYKVFCVVPVDLSALTTNLKNENFSNEELAERVEDAKELGVYFQERFKAEFEKRGLTVSLMPIEEAFVWEIAIVELKPTLAAVNAAATAAGAFVPGAGMVRRFGTGSIAIEVIVRDGKTKDMLAEFKDRESDKDSLFTVRDFQMYSHARNAIDDWAEQFAELSSTTGDVTVDDSLPITLNPF